MTPFPEAEEFRALLDALCEDRITPAQLARLEELVLTRPEAEAYYVQYLGLYAELANTFSVPARSAEQVLRNLLGASPEAGLHSTQRISPRADRRPGRLPLRMAAAVVVVAALITAGWSLLGRRAATVPGDIPVAVDETAPPQDAGAERFSNTVALMRDSSSAKWAAETPPIESGSTIPPGRLRLESGLVEIEFYSGATVVLEGPADFQIVSSMEAFCTRGKLRANVPPHAKGFTIGTPRLDLVDRGTEFGMSVDGSAATEVHVFEGKVELYRSGSDPRKASPDRELTTGQAVRIEGLASADTIASDSDAFVSSEELSARTRAVARGRQREWKLRRDARLRDPGLAIYYTFEPQEEWTRTLKNRVDRQPSGDGTIVGCNWVAGRWPGKTALDFRQVSDRVRLNLPGEFDAVTVAMWARIDALPNRFNSLLMSDSWESSEGHWHISNERTIQLGVRGMGGKSSARYTSPKGLDPEFLGRWTHFAMVYDRAERKVTHYVNGQVFCELPLVLDAPLRFGDTELGNWSPGNVTSFPERFLTGRIDEFVLYTRALPPQEVEGLAEEIEARE